MSAVILFFEPFGRPCPALPDLATAYPPYVLEAPILPYPPQRTASVVPWRAGHSIVLCSWLHLVVFAFSFNARPERWLYLPVPLPSIHRLDAAIAVRGTVTNT